MSLMTALLIPFIAVGMGAMLFYIFFGAARGLVQVEQEYTLPICQKIADLDTVFLSEDGLSIEGKIGSLNLAFHQSSGGKGASSDFSIIIPKMFSPNFQVFASKSFIETSLDYLGELKWYKTEDESYRIQINEAVAFEFNDRQLNCFHSLARLPNFRKLANDPISGKMHISFFGPLPIYTNFADIREIVQIVDRFF